MFAATTKFLRQIIPPVIATLIAALLIAGFNRAFSTHLTQPRLGGLNAQADAEGPNDRVLPRPATARSASPVEAVEEPAPAREWQKGGVREAAKEPVGIRTAEAAPAAQPAPAVTRRPEARPVETRQAETRQIAAESRQVETRRAEPHVIAAPVAVAPPVVIAVPVAPPVIAPPVVVAAPLRQEPVYGEPPMVTVPDRPRPQSPFAEPPAQPPQPQGRIGTIANTLNPSTWFARAREFGEKIEAVGNEILPSIRQ